MRIAVTGGAGAIGRYVCDELISAEHDVVCVDRREPDSERPCKIADLLSLEATRSALGDVDCIAHLAAIPDPFQGDPPERVMSVNTTLSYNVFEAARLNGIPRVIYGCSESSTGLGIHHVKLRPNYVPIDEVHPLRPHETYSLSKYFGERIGANYAGAFGIEVVSLRYVWVWTRRVAQEAKRIVEQARRGTDLDRVDDKDWLGGHIAVRDVARAFSAAVEFRFPDFQSPFEAFFLSARDTFHTVPTLDLLVKAFGSCPSVSDESYFETNPTASAFDIRKAKRLMGWEPTHHWNDFESWEL